MRSTLKISTNMALDNILDNYSRLLKVQNQMASGNRVNRPSDDPLSTNEGMRLDTIITRTRQFNRNLDVGKSFLSLSDAALGDVTDILRRSKAIAIGGASETTTSEMRRTNAVEVRNMMQELVTIGNRNDGQRYIFGGTQTTSSAYEIIAGKYVRFRGNDDAINVQGDLASTVPINVTGSQVYGNLEAVIGSRDLSPDIQVGLDRSTRLDDLNLGEGVPDGSINIKFTAASREGIDIDLSGADTVEDVIDIVYKETLAYSRTIDPDEDGFGFYVQLGINENNNGFTVTEIDPADITGSSFPDKSFLEISEVGDNTVARALGILGKVEYEETFPATTPPTTTGKTLVGNDLDPALTEHTLLADLKDFLGNSFTITNGAKPGEVPIHEKADINNVLDHWNLVGLDEGINTGVGGELYAEIIGGGGKYTVNLYRDAERLPSQLVATGSTNTFVSPTIELEERNGSGIAGTVSTTASTASGVLELQAVFDPTFRTTVNVPAFEENVDDGGDPYDQFSNWRLRGMNEQMFNGTDGKLHVTVQSSGGAETYYGVGLYLREEATGAFTQVATGNLIETYTTAPMANLNYGPVELHGLSGTAYANVVGSVDLDWNENAPSPPGATEALPAANPDPDLGTATTTVTPTWKTVGDLLDEINHAEIYAHARIDDEKRGIGIVSELGGAWLTVDERLEYVPLDGDDQFGANSPQLGKLDLNGMVQGVNTDSEGQVYIEILRDDTPDPNSANTINLYSDADMENLVASGEYIGDPSLVTPPPKVVLYAQNDSRLSGTVEFLQQNPPPDPTTWPDDESYYRDIVARTRAFRVTNLTNSTGATTRIGKLDLRGVTQGVNADEDGKLYATLGYNVKGDSWQEINRLNLTTIDPAALDSSGRFYLSIDATPGAEQVNFYNDAGMTGADLIGTAAINADGLVNFDFDVTPGPPPPPNLTGSLHVRLPITEVYDTTVATAPQIIVDTTEYAVTLYDDDTTLLGEEGYRNSVAKGVPNAAGEVAFSQVNGSGISGSLELTQNPSGIPLYAQDTDIVFHPPRGFLNSAQVRQDNIFATMNDSIDALQTDDTDALTELLGNFDIDEDRVLDTRAGIGSRINRMEMLYYRHEDEIINFSSIRSDRIDLDYADAIVKFQAAQNIFEAALRTSGKLIPMSLVDFI